MLDDNHVQQGIGPRVDSPAAFKADRRLVLAGTERGGAGKSFFMTQFVEWLRQHPRGPQFVAFDPGSEFDNTQNRFDGESGVLVRVHGPKSKRCVPKPSEVRFLDVMDSEAMDEVMKVLASEDGPVISVVDGMGSQFERVFMGWAREIMLFTEIAPEAGVRPTIVLLMDEVIDTVTQGRRLMDEIGTGADWLIVRNQKIMRHLPWDVAEDTRSLAFKALGAKEVTLPEINPRLIEYLNGNVDERRHSIAGAIEETQNSFHRNRFRTMWGGLATQLDAAEPLLLPPSWVG